MSFSGLALNQAVSYGNLQDAVNNGIYTLKSTIPSPANRESTKSVVSSTISGFNPNYPGYAIKSNNELIVKRDIYVTGNVTLLGQYGMSITGITATGFPSFSYPVISLASGTYVNIINGQTITVSITGTRETTPLSISLYVGNSLIQCQGIPRDGAQNIEFVLPTVYAPNFVYIAIDYGACPTTPVPNFGNQPFSAVAICKGTTGQYQMIAGGAVKYADASVRGYLYKSSDYGASWIQLGTLIGYWNRVCINTSGNNILVCESGGSLYYSSNGGGTFINVGLNISNPTYPTSGVIFWNAIAMSDDGTRLIASYQVYDQGQGRTGYFVYLSTNSGTSWTDISSSVIGDVIYGSSNIGFICAGMSSSGQYIYIGTNSPNSTGALGPKIYKSSNYGSTWSAGTYHGTLVSTLFRDISVSEDGSTYVAAGVQIGIPTVYLTAGHICKSTDYGANIYEITSGSGGSELRTWQRIGLYQYYQPYPNPPYTYGFKAMWYAFEKSGSTNPSTSALKNSDSLGDVQDGSTTGMGSQKFTAIAVGGGSGGGYVLISADNGVWRSTNGGDSWTKL